MGLIKRFETSYSKACQNSFSIYWVFKRQTSQLQREWGPISFFYQICPELYAFRLEFSQTFRTNVGTRILTYVLISNVKTVV